MLPLPQRAFNAFHNRRKEIADDAAFGGCDIDFAGHAGADGVGKGSRDQFISRRFDLDGIAPDCLSSGFLGPMAA